MFTGVACIYPPVIMISVSVTLYRYLDLCEATSALVRYNGSQCVKPALLVVKYCIYFVHICYWKWCCFYNITVKRLNVAYCISKSGVCILLHILKIIIKIIIIIIIIIIIVKESWCNECLHFSETLSSWPGSRFSSHSHFHRRHSSSPRSFIPVSVNKPPIVIAVW